MDRKTITDAYVRVCRDSGFQMEATAAAHFVAKLLNIHAFDVWFAMDLSTMRRIADGTHPAARA